MDLAKVLVQLRAELENLNIAIASLEKLAAQKHSVALDEPVEARRPGRPRKTPSDSIGVQRRGNK